MEETDPADELFAEMAPSTSDSGDSNDNDSKNKDASPMDGLRKVLARAFDIEITISSGVPVSENQQRRIDKLLSDVAQLLRCDDDDETLNQSALWYVSSRNAEIDADGINNERVPIFKSDFDVSVSESASFVNPVPCPEPSRQERTMSCFNCEGSHNVADCLEPKDQIKIRKNRLLFQQKASASPAAGRYHRERDARFSQYVPGKISDSLRDVLGLRADDIPPWIYEMRILGYPPGYFRALLQPPTKLTIYNDLSVALKENETEAELDISKFVEYPGFNMPVPPGVHDEHRRYGYPPMLPEYMKDHFLASVTGKRFASSVVEEVKQRNECYSDGGVKTQEMEISDEDDIRTAQTEETPRSSRTRRSRSKSPSVEALEETRREILAQLEADEPPPKRQRLNLNGNAYNGSLDSSSAEDDSVVEVTSPDASPDPGTEQTFRTPKRNPLNGCVEESPSCSSSGVRSTSVNAGTPLRGAFVRGSKPDLDNFAAHVSPFSPKEESPVVAGRGFKNLKEMLKGKRLTNSLCK